tara:strand:- start:40 stop:255 length:216 start_codon:yes stop_codon:yes gene_type:complete
MSTETTKETSGVNAKEMLKGLAKEGRKIKFESRVKLEIIKKTKFYKLGQIINPHVTFGERLISDKIAKKIK